LQSKTGFWGNRRVFITGCTGIVGSWLTLALVDAGAQVVGLIYDESPRSHLLRTGYDRRIVRTYGSVADYGTIRRIVNQYQPQTIFHLAAQSLVTAAERDPLITLETNVRGTWNLLEAARLQSSYPHVIVASTDKAYGDQEALPYKEDTPLLARYPYDVSKSCADMIAASYHHTYGLPVGMTRCGNIYGGGDLYWDRIIPSTIRWALRGERPILRSDGTMTRDYMYVQDVVSGYLRLAERLDDPAVQGQAFNFGLDDPKSVLEIVEATLQAAGRPDLEPVVLGTAKHEIQDQYLDASKAAQMLDWGPQYTLQEGLRETVAWEQAYYLGEARNAATARQAAGAEHLASPTRRI
jgi:CDP-glucose 4,6-dehydratase